MSFRNLIKNLERKAKNINFVILFNISIFLKFLNFRRLSFYEIADLLEVLVKYLEVKVNYFLGKYKREEKERKKEKKKEKIKKKDKKRVKVEEDIGEIEVLLILKVGKRIRKCFLEDLGLIEIKIRKRIEYLKEKLIIKILARKINELYKEIIELINRIKIAKFSEITFGKKKFEKVVTFSYLVLLANEGKIELEQEDLFGEIIIRKNE